MNLLNLTTLYPDEESCKAKWKEFRDEQQIVCIHCGCKEHYWKKDKENYECKQCGYRQSLKANTLMHGSQLPFRYWFVAIHLLLSAKKNLSAKELQRQLGHSTYNPIWSMLHKLRRAMSNPHTRHQLAKVVELNAAASTKNKK
jgi:hypothetical protein